MIPFLAQTVALEPETVQALSDLGIAAIALLIVGGAIFVVYKALDAINAYSQALEKIGDRLAVNQSKDEDLREKTRLIFDKAADNFQKVGDALDTFRTGIDKRLEDQSDALRGRDGVLERLKTSALQMDSLGEEVKTVVKSANSIIENLDVIKEAVSQMNTSDNAVRTQIEAIQNQLKELTGAVSSIPAAVGDAEKNIIAVIERRVEPKADTRPVPPISEIVIQPKPEDLNGKDKSNETPETKLN